MGWGCSVRLAFGSGLLLSLPIRPGPSPDLPSTGFDSFHGGATGARFGLALAYS